MYMYNWVTTVEQKLTQHYISTKCVLSRFSPVQLCVTPWAVAHQAPLSMKFSRQGHGSGLLCPLPGDLPDPGTNWRLLSLLHRQLAGWFFTKYPPHNVIVRVNSTTYVQDLSQSNIQQILIISWCRQRKRTETSKRNWQSQVARFCSLRMKSSWTLCVSRGVCVKQVFLHKYPSYPRKQEETTPNQ